MITQIPHIDHPDPFYHPDSNATSSPIGKWRSIFLPWVEARTPPRRLTNSLPLLSVSTIWSREWPLLRRSRRLKVRMLLHQKILIRWASTSWGQQKWDSMRKELQTTLERNKRMICFNPEEPLEEEAAFKKQCQESEAEESEFDNWHPPVDSIQSFTVANACDYYTSTANILGHRKKQKTSHLSTIVIGWVQVCKDILWLIFAPCFIAIVYSLPVKKIKLFDQFNLCVRVKNENPSFFADGLHAISVHSEKLWR